MIPHFLSYRSFWKYYLPYFAPPLQVKRCSSSTSTMGSNASRLAKKLTVPFRSSSTEDVKSNSNTSAVKSSSCPLVFSRRGSMYKDEDGDLAHEFYVEVPPTQGSKATMKRVYDNLTPQGEVYYDNARLNSDFPYIVANI